MFRSDIAKPLGGPSFLFWLQHVFFIGVVFWQIAEVMNYKTATRGTFSVAEAAYVTSLWTSIMVSVGAWIAWTIFCGTFIVTNRINALHEAYVSGFPIAPAEVGEPGGPRIGNHSLAGVERQEIYRGRPYAVHGDGAVVGWAGDAVATWRNEFEFKSWADRNPVPS